MKKIILIIVGAFCLSAFAVEVQAQDGPKQDTTGIQPSQSYRDDMVKITSDDLPEAVKATLQGAEYKGWETANRPDLAQGANPYMFWCRIKMRCSEWEAARMWECAGHRLAHQLQY